MTISQSLKFITFRYLLYLKLFHCPSSLPCIFLKALFSYAQQRFQFSALLHATLFLLNIILSISLHRQSRKQHLLFNTGKQERFLLHFNDEEANTSFHISLSFVILFRPSPLYFSPVGFFRGDGTGEIDLFSESSINLVKVWPIEVQRKLFYGFKKVTKSRIEQFKSAEFTQS